MKKAMALVLALAVLMSMSLVGTVTASAASDCVSGVYFGYPTDPDWGGLEYDSTEPATASADGLSRSVGSGPNAAVPGAFIGVTFNAKTTVNSISFKLGKGSEFPSVKVQYRLDTTDDGSPLTNDECKLTDGEGWGGVFWFAGHDLESSTKIDGDVATVTLAAPIHCIAVLIQTEDGGSAPWNVKDVVINGQASGGDTESSEEASKEPAEVTLGDVNGDGKINALDASRILLSSVGKITLNADQQKAADINGDDKVNALDASRVLLHAVGKKLIGA